ncbi:MAG: NAAT family transporter [Proteobacteria bacterium]|nr:NAAT family transporter [Pseudomonadota bacterium]MDE3207317.1 NAAT family transporter [Pseudomonadota bacterium]
MDWTYYLKALVALSVIVNPVGAVPVFLTVTDGQDREQRKRTARLTGFSVACVLVVACLTGESILRFFGISLASFRVGGGLLIMLMAIHMMQAKISPSRQTPEEAREAEDRESVAVVPLAIPLLSGPGAITTAILYANHIHTILGMSILIASAIVVGLFVWLMLLLADPVSHWLGHTGINIATRLMGLLLAAIAVEFITQGVAILLPGLA